VNACWSVTMYEGKTQFLIENPINRYLINSPILPGMKKNPDGSLTLYIQKDNPGADKESNWLPAPNDLSTSSCASIALGFQYAEVFAVPQHELRDADFPRFGERFAQ
jgi:hypothetical protein